MLSSALLCRSSELQSCVGELVSLNIVICDVLRFIAICAIFAQVERSRTDHSSFCTSRLIDKFGEVALQVSRSLDVVNVYPL
jgi:hypothetical protein